MREMREIRLLIGVIGVGVWGVVLFGLGLLGEGEKGLE